MARQAAARKGARRPQPKDEAEVAGGRYKVEAVSRAVLLLEAFRQAPGPMPAERLAQRTGLTTPTVEATLATLERSGLVHRRGEGDNADFELGLAWLRLADVKRQQIDIREVALPIMLGMRDEVGETVSLGIRIGANRVNIEYAESLHEVRRIVQPGFHVPLHVGAGGRAILSGLQDTEIEGYLAAVPISQTDKSALIAEIKDARKAGYSVVEGEVTSDTAAVAAPVRNHVGEVVAVLAISLPKERFSRQMRQRCVKVAVDGARALSLALGLDPQFRA